MGHEPNLRIYGFIGKKSNPCSCIEFGHFWALKRYNPKPIFSCLFGHELMVCLERERERKRERRVK